MELPIGVIDLVVLLASIAISVVVGLRLSGKNDSIEAYLLGGRDLPWWAILGSIVATETSTATVLSVPGHGYGVVGFRFLQLAIGYIVGRFLVIQLLLPRYFDGKLMSAYEILGYRFGDTAKRFASILFLVTRNLGDGLRLFLAATVLETLAGWPLEWSALAMGGITVLYTYFGGMRSVVWNDCIQFVIYMAGGVAAIFVIWSYLPNGWQTFYEFGVANNKFTLFDWSLSLANPFTFWAGLIGGSVLSLGSHGTDQMMVQRYLSARSQKDAAKALWWSGWIVFAQFALFLFIGMLLHCFYSTIDDLPADTKPDQIFAHFLVNSFPKNTGLIGLMLAAILAAAMSTLSSSLSASASSLVSDLWLPRCSKEPTQKNQVWVTRAAIVMFGVVQVVIGIWARNFDKSVVDNALTIAGFSSGVLLGLFALAVFAKHVKGPAAIVAAFIGIVVLLAVQYGLPQVGYNVAFPWLPLIGSIATLCAGIIVSMVRSDSNQEFVSDSK
ncbi:MAG: sodium:solute symporter [Pirellula sp.]